MLVLVLTGLVVVVVGWGCLGCVWYGFVSFVDDRLVFLSSLQRYSFSAILSPCFSLREDGRWDGGGTGVGHRPHLNALTLTLITSRLCPRRDIDLAFTH